MKANFHLADAIKVLALIFSLQPSAWAVDTTLTEGVGTNVTEVGSTVVIDLEVPITIARGGTGAVSHTDGGVLIGKGTAAFANTGVLAAGSTIIGDGVTDPTTVSLLSSATGVLNAARFPALSGAVITTAGSTVTSINTNQITEPMLKSIDTPAVAECLKYTTVAGGDFYWDTCGTGGGGGTGGAATADIDMGTFSLDGSATAGLLLDPDNDDTNEWTFGIDGSLTSNGSTISRLSDGTSVTGFIDFANFDGGLTLGGLGGANGFNESFQMDFDVVSNSITLDSTTQASTFNSNIGWRAKNDVEMQFGNSAIGVRQDWNTVGNDNWQWAIGNNAATSSGYITVVQMADVGHANRSPVAAWPNGATTTNPTLYLASNNEAVPGEGMHLYHDGTSPTIGYVTGGLKLKGTATPTHSCGSTGAAMAAGSNNNVGRMTIGSSSVTSCTMTFSGAYATPPSCVAVPTSAPSAPIYVSTTTTTMQLESASSFANKVLNYQCFGF
jgi:hypothetical protein